MTEYRHCTAINGSFTYRQRQALRCMLRDELREYYAVVYRIGWLRCRGVVVLTIDATESDVLSLCSPIFQDQIVAEAERVLGR